MTIDRPIEECVKLAAPYVTSGTGKFFQKWTCGHCQSRQTMEEENKFFTSGICGECGKETKIEACGFLLQLGPG